MSLIQPLIGSNLVTGAADFDTTLIGNSIWLDGSADFLNRQNGSDFSNRKEVTLSFWVQRNEFGDGTINTQQAIFAGLESGNGFIIQFTGNDTLELHLNGTANLVTNAFFRDIGWYHILVSIDTSQAVSSDRSKVYINGEQITSFSSAAYPSQNSNIPGISGQMTSTENMRIGNYNNAVSNFYFWNGYIAQACMIESKSIQQGDFAVSDFLDTFTFGTNGSQVIPKKDSDIAALATTAGGNSFCLDFGDSSNLGNDISSNNNDFTATSMSGANQSTHTPSKSYPILNVLDPTTATASSGNLNFAGPSADNKAAMRTTIGIPDNSGKFYFEYEMTGGSNDALMFGIAGDGSANGGYDDWVQDITPSIAVYTESGSNVLYEDGSQTSTSLFGSAPSSGDIIGVAYDSATRKVWFALNNTYAGSGDPAAGTGETATLSSSGTAFPTVSARGSSDTLTLRFDSSDFTHSAPTGYNELNTANLTAPSYQGIDYFDVTLYEGNGQNQRVGDFVPFTDTYIVDKSAMFDDGDRRYLARTYTASDAARSSNSQATISYWIKFCSNGANQDILTTSNSGQTLRLRHYINDQAGQQSIYMTLDGPSTNRDFEIPISKLSEQEWTNIVYHLDVDNSTAADKIKCWVNGVQQTSTDTSYQSASNADYFLFANEEHFIGNLAPASAGYTVFSLNSYLAEMHVLDGQLKAPTDFGQVDTSTNRWVPKDYKTNVGTYGNRGFYMAFDNATGTGNGVGTDSSGNGFNFTESFVSGGSAWATSDTVTDTPSKNFAVWDGGRKDGNTLSEGSLKVTGDAGADMDSVLGTMFVSSGKYYWEIERDSDTGGSDRFRAGVAIDSYPPTTSMDDRTDAWGISENGQKIGGGLPLTNYGDSTTTGDFIGVALDMDRNAIYFSKNGTWMNSASASGIADGTDYSKAAFSNVIGSVTPFLQTYDAQVATLRTASGRWESTAPTGFLELNQDNLDDTSSKITALAWIKNRDAADDNIWMDRVIGTSGYLSTTQNDSGAAATAHGDGGSDVLTTNANVVQRFLQRGVQIGNDENVNTAGESYVLWQWLLGDSATTGSSITTGSPSLATTGVVSDAKHFSIVQYTGNGTDNATFAHGLGATPNFVMVKRISGSATNSDWVIHIPGLGTENYIYPHYRIALATGAGQNGMVPDANLVEISTGVATNTSGATHMAYSFKNTPGLCKIGTYTGNSSTNGTYVSTGFKPRFIWIFNTTLTSADAERPIFDTARYKFNGATTAGGSNGGVVFSDQRAAEEAQNTSLGVNPAIDILSDGFKLRANDSTINTGTTYLYISMADIAGGGTLPPIYGR